MHAQHSQTRTQDVQSPGRVRGRVLAVLLVQQLVVVLRVEHVRAVLGLSHWAQAQVLGGELVWRLPVRVPPAICPIIPDNDRQRLVWVTAPPPLAFRMNQINTCFLKQPLPLGRIA